jgi:hypothetical protein
VLQSESEAQTRAPPFGHPPAIAGVLHVALPPKAEQQIWGDVQLVLVHGGGWHRPFAHVPPFAHSPVPVPLQSCVAPVGHALSHTSFVAGAPNPPPPPSATATGSLQQTCEPHCAALVHCVTVPVQAEAPDTHAYDGAPIAPAVRQQNGCVVEHDRVVEVGGHATLALTTIPASVTAPVPLEPVPVAPVAPVLLPVEAPVLVPLVPVDVPEVPVLVPLVPDDPLLVEPPHATPTATATSELTRIARTGFKTSHLRHP